MNVEEASSSSGSSFPRKREPSGLVFRSTPGSAESHWVDQPFGLLRSASAFAGMTAVGWLARACSGQPGFRSEEHTSELQSLMRISYAVFCLKKKTTKQMYNHDTLI